MDNSRYIDLLRQMVRTPSLSFEEEAVCEVICSALKDWGIEHQVLNGNIVSFNRHFDPSKPTLALDAHIDTVPPCGGYSFDPHDPGEDPDIVRGLGSNDDGGSVVCLIATFSHFYEAQLPFNLMLTLSCEEERSGPDGARWLYGERFMGEVKWAIIGEPTQMKAATSERGLLVLDAVAHGISAHAARGGGDNALYKAVDDILALRSHHFSRHSEIMGDVKLSITQIQAGEAHNVIPDECRFVVDIRPTEKYTNTEILEELQSICKSELTARNLTNRSSATPSDSPLLMALDQLGIETFSSPTTSNWMRIGCEAIKMGPGDSPRSHKADEYILTSEIEEAIDTYIRFIETFSHVIDNTLEQGH